jgi:molybdopterin converting factor small subunit
MLSVLYFGPIQSITSLSKEQLSLVTNLGELNELLCTKYPKLKDAHYVFSVNQKICETAQLKENDEVALLPPFSGG